MPSDESQQFKVDKKKSFCSEKCFTKYSSEYMKPCELPGCQKTFFKAGKPYIAGKWFCSEEHAEQHPDTQKFLELMEKEDEISERNKMQ